MLLQIDKGYILLYVNVFPKRAASTLQRHIRVISIRNGGPRHLDVVAAQEEQQRVAGQADGVGDEHELHGALGPQLQPLQQAAAHEDADTRARDRYGTCTNKHFH